MKPEFFDPNYEFLKNRAPLTKEQVKDFIHLSEKVFALAVCAIPHLVLYHEPCQFRGESNSSSLPDFFLINAANPYHQGIFIEVTCSPILEMNKQKTKQRAVMTKAVSDYGNLKYIQLNGAVTQKLLQRLITLEEITDEELLDLPDGVKTETVVVS